MPAALLVVLPFAITWKSLDSSVRLGLLIAGLAIAFALWRGRIAEARYRARLAELEDAIDALRESTAEYAPRDTAGATPSPTPHAANATSPARPTTPVPCSS